MATTSRVSFVKPLTLNSLRECCVGCCLRQWDSRQFPPEGTDTLQAPQSLPTLFILTPVEDMFVALMAPLSISVLTQQEGEKTNLVSHIACLRAKPINMFSRTYFPVSELCWHSITPSSPWVFIILILISIINKHSTVNTVFDSTSQKHRVAGGHRKTSLYLYHSHLYTIQGIWDFHLDK